MAKKIKGAKLIFEVTDDGSLKLLEGKLKNTKKATDNLSRSEATLNRNFKGASQQSSNTTKNFSKMAQGITGGLVPAYATLAANIFAITAAFRFLQDAANFRILIEGQQEFATRTGDSLATVTRRLREATGGQLAFAEAAQSAAIGRAAGLSATQLSRLGTLAKNASIALGRDLTDSFNRLVRGVTKAEPELLDELGIILRLNTATEKYARTIGKSATQLNIFEKTQAVANEVLSQGESKFAEFNTELNKFNKLAVAFDDLINQIKGGLSGVAEFIATGLSKNIFALAGAFALLGSGIIQAITPDVPQLDVAGGAQAARKGLLAKSMFTEKGAKKFGSLKSDKEIKAFEMAISRKKSLFINYENFQRAEAEKTAALLRANQLETEASAAGSFKRMGLRFKAEMLLMEAEHGKVMGRIKFGFMQLGKAVRALGYIGLIVSVIGVLSQYFERLEDPATRKFREEQERIAESFKATANEIQNTINNLVVADDIFTNLVKRGKLIQSLDFSNLDKFSGEEGQASFLQKINRFMLGLNFNQGSDKITEGDKGIVEGVIAQLSTAQSAVQGTQAARDLGAEFILPLRKALISGDIKAIGTIFAEIQRQVREGGTLEALKDIFELADAPQIIKNATDEFEKGFGTLRTATTPLTGATMALQNMQDVLIKTAKTARENESLAIGEAGLEGNEIKALETMLGIETVRTIMEDKRLDTLGKIDALQTAVADRQADFIKFEEDFLLKKDRIQTVFSEKIQGEGKLTQKNLKIQEKIFQIANELDLLQEKKRLRDEGNLTMDATQVKVEEDRIKNLMKKLELAKKEADIFEQVNATFRDALEQGLAGAFTKLMEGTATLKDAFLEMTRAVLRAIAQILAQQAAISIMSMVPGLPLPGVGSRYGGVMSKTGKSFATGGIPSGPESGYPVTLHGTEAVVPLGNDRHIPVKFEGKAGSAGNVTVNVNMASGETQATGDDSLALGKAIATAVQQEISKQQRPGGTLSPY